MEISSINQRPIHWLRSLWPLRIALGSLVVLSIVSTGASQTADNPLAESFRRRLNLTAEESTALERGDPVVRILRAKDRREVGVNGIVRLQANPATSFKAFQQSITQQKSDRAANGNPFGNPARIEDLQALTLSPREIADLQHCSIGSCKFKLSAEMIERFQNEIDWTQPDRDSKAILMFRQMLVDYVQRYVQEGDAALIEYRDGSRPVKVADEYRSLLPEFSYLTELAPELIDYLSNYPHQELKGVTNEIVWAKVSFGLKPVVIVTHQTTYQPEPGRIFLISKQIYANHYFDSSLGLTVISGQSGGPTDAYLLYVNHSRAAALDGAFSGLKHRLVEREAANSLADLLLSTRANLQLKPVAETGTRYGPAGVGEWLLRRVIWLVPLGLLMATLFWLRRRILQRENPALARAKTPTSSFPNKTHSGI